MFDQLRQFGLDLLDDRLDVYTTALSQELLEHPGLGVVLDVLNEGVTLD